MTKTTARILIVENDNDWRTEYREMVAGLNFEAVVAEGSGNKLIRDAIAKCQVHCCHVAIVDMRLRDNSDRRDFSGIDDVAVRLSPASVIVVSGYIDLDIANKKSEQAKSLGIDLKFINKKDASEDLSSQLQRLALEKSSAAKRISLTIATKSFASQLDQFLARMGYEKEIERGREVLSDLLVQLYNDATGFELKPIDPSPNTASTTLVRNSFVCRVDLQGSSRMDQVIKFARPSAIKAEHLNYKNYIHRHVPWQSYAGLDERPALSCQIGAIGLDMVFTKPFSSRYRLATEIKDVNSIVQSIQYFSENWTHYTSEKSSDKRCDGKDFLTTYITAWDQNKDADADTFKKRLDDAAPEERWTHSLPASLIPDPTLPNPVYWLKERSARETAFSGEKVRLGITHGDAWGENLFVTSQGTTIWIDYERTGLGYILQDFVRLEFDVLTRMIQQSDDESGWRSLFYLYTAVIRNNELTAVIDLLSQDHELQKAVSVVTKIREEARNHARGKLDTRQYLMAMLFDAVFRSTLRQPRISEDADDDTLQRYNDELKTWEIEKRRAMLIGALIIDKIDAERKTKPWPPPNWGPFLTKELLRKAITRYPWTRDTVTSLMFDVLGTAYEDFDGDTLNTKMISFYRACEEQGKLDDLLMAIQKVIPNFPKGLED